jgi:Rps23 Pro-64 3,4-dihydroxylase Tpa1-like proline 4-hydroxylase
VVAWRALRRRLHDWSVRPYGAGDAGERVVATLFAQCRVAPAMTSNELTTLIVRRLNEASGAMRAAFQRPAIGRTRLAVVDDVLPKALAEEIYRAFPPEREMRLMASFREHKYTSKSLERMQRLVHDALFAFQAPDVLEQVAAITGIRDMVADPQLYAGGISAMTKGQFLDPHIDNSHDAEGRRYRVLNLLYYVTPGWRADFGGNLELWDEKVRERLEVPSLFNRLVVMETNRTSWHSVNPVKVDGKRCCVSNYYFSPHSPNAVEVSHVTFFHGRPEQPLRRLLATADGYARTLIRRVIKRGLGKEDLYRGERPRD